jgi:hypothetical protein
MTQAKDQSASQENDKPWRVLGSAAIAKRYGVLVQTIAQWRRRGEYYGIPFPAPSTETTTHDPNIVIPGWDESKLPEIDEWKQTIETRPEWRAIDREGHRDDGN